MKIFLEQLELILNKMNDIEYGFADNNGNIYPDDDENWDNSFQTKYLLQSPNDLLKNKYGVCWDQVELERFYLENINAYFNSYFIINYDDKIFPTHTFIIVSFNNCYFWIEHSWFPHRGIHKYDSLNNALNDIKNKFNNMIKNKYSIDNDDTVIYMYNKPAYNIDANSFFKHCESGIKITL